MDLEMMDDYLVRQIEGHLAGAPRASTEYGEDQKYIQERESRETQKFDVAGYEKYKLAESLEKMGPYEKQQELLFRRKQAQVEVGP